ncbi:hypothetical protein ACPF8X_14255 [Streptomyces sp. G35A]
MTRAVAPAAVAVAVGVLGEVGVAVVFEGLGDAGVAEGVAVVFEGLGDAGVAEGDAVDFVGLGDAGVAEGDAAVFVGLGDAVPSGFGAVDFGVFAETAGVLDAVGVGSPSSPPLPTRYRSAFPSRPPSASCPR